MPLSDSPFD